MKHLFPARSSRPAPPKAIIRITALLALAAASITTTVTAQEAPVIINQETGAQVDLVRPYWNANVDIANRRLQCDHFMFDPETAVYEQQQAGGHPASAPWRSDSEYFHSPLFEGGGLSTVDHGFLADYRANTWYVSDGLYTGMAPLNGFVELVTYNAADSDTDISAVRVWHVLQDTDPFYYVCYDLDGASFEPTGSAETGNTELLPEQNFTFQLPRAGTPVTVAPEIVRRDTGELVEFVRAEFDYNGDFKGRALNCGPFRWDEQRGYSPVSRGDGLGSYFGFDYAYTGGAEVSHTFAWDDAGDLPSASAVDGFLHWTTRDASFIEVVESGYNIWYPESGAGVFDGCRLIESPWVESQEPFAPNRILLTAQGSCDYSTADQYDGWGWNEATQQGCPPEDNPDNGASEENTDEQDASDTDSTVDQSDNGENTVPEDTDANGTGGTSEGGDDTTDNPDTGDSADTPEDSTDNPDTEDSTDSTGDGATDTTTTEDQSGSDVDSTVQSSGGGAIDRFLLLFLICFLGRRR